MKTLHITKPELHTFIDGEIEKYKSKKGRAFFYKKPKRMEIVGEKRVMRFDTKDRQFQIDGATGKRLYKKGGKRTTTPEHNMLVTDLDIQEGASVAVMKRAFMKSTSAKRLNRQLLNKFIKMVA